MIAAIPNSSYKYQANRAAGFTLIELMVTIAVLAIIVSIAAPNVSTQLANQKVKATTATLTNALQEAKAESVIRRQSIKLVYNNNGSAAGNIKIEDANNKVIANYSYNKDINLLPASANITFKPSKRTDKSASVIYKVCHSATAVPRQQVTIKKTALISNSRLTKGVC